MGLRVEFDERSTDGINFLRVALELESNTDVLRRAIALLRVCTEAKMRGEHIVIISADEQKEREVVL